MLERIARRSSLALLSTLFLAACGGGGSDSGAEPNGAPSPFLQTTTGTATSRATPSIRTLLR